MLGANDVFASGVERQRDREPVIQRLQAKIGELTMECDFLSGKLKRQAPSAPERRAMVDRDALLPVARQRELLQVTRATVHYGPAPMPEVTRTVMRALDEIRLPYPFPPALPPVRIPWGGVAVGGRGVLDLHGLARIVASRGRGGNGGGGSLSAGRGCLGGYLQTALVL